MRFPSRLVAIATLFTVCLLMAPPAIARPALFAGGPQSYRANVQDRVMQLPEDGDMWDVMIIADQAQLQQFNKAFAESPRLASLARQTKVHRIAPDSWWSRYWMTGGDFPIVMVQTATNKLIYKASGSNMPSDAEQLADEIELKIEQYRSDCGPDCKPSPTRPKPRIPDARPDGGGGQPAKISNEAVLIVLALLGGLGWFVYQRSKSA